MMDELPRNHFGAILADPPWHFSTWSPKGMGRAPKYETMYPFDMQALPVAKLAADDCVLFVWATWPALEDCMDMIYGWGFEYKTCAFCWMKANGRQLDMFNDEIEADMKLGYWTRANSEVCLLATRGKPKRFNADVRQGIIEPARQHSRKPNCVQERIERLVAGPYLELFARQERSGWTCWGNETKKFRQAVACACLEPKE